MKLMIIKFRKRLMNNKLIAFPCLNWVVSFKVQIRVNFILLSNAKSWKKKLFNKLNWELSR